MANGDWYPFLKQWSVELLDAHIMRGADIPSSARTAGWMGFQPASEDQIVVAEARIGKKLPPSYRAFLKVTNGWRSTGGFIDKLWSAEELDWFSARNQQWIDAYNSPQYADLSVTEEEHRTYGTGQAVEAFRTEYMKTALEISDIGDSAILLLNPLVVTEDGEWEAWMLANWLPGAARYRSFWELMQAQYEDFAQAEKQERKRFKPSDAPESLLDKLDNLVEELNGKATQWRQITDPTGIVNGYNAAILRALEETAQQVGELRRIEHDPAILKQRILALADSFIAEVREDASHRMGVGEIFQIPLIPGKFAQVMDAKGRIEGKREAAGIIHWFFESRNGLS